MSKQSVISKSTRALRSQIVRALVAVPPQCTLQRIFMAICSRLGALDVYVILSPIGTPLGMIGVGGLPW